MTKKSKPQGTENEPGEDLATFKNLPEKTKKLMKLKDQDEKSTGPEHTEITKKIEEKSRPKDK